jgi:hypothetical protein
MEWWIMMFFCLMFSMTVAERVRFSRWRLSDQDLLGHAHTLPQSNISVHTHSG